MPAPEPEFDSLEEVHQVWYDGDRAPGEYRWEVAEQIAALEPNWTLSRLEAQSANAERFSIARGTGPTTVEVLGPDGVEELNAAASFNEWPLFESEEAAREAHAEWLESNEGQNERDEDNPWGEWQQARQVGNWVIWIRQHSEEDRAQYAMGGSVNGTDLWIHPEGDVGRERYAFDSLEALQEAYAAYQQRIQDGEDLPQPNGPPSGPPDPDPSSGTPGGGGGGGSLAELASNPLVLVGVAGAGYVAYRNSRGN